MVTTFTTANQSLIRSWSRRVHVHYHMVVNSPPLKTSHVKLLFPLIVISFAWLLLNTYLGISMQVIAIPTARDGGRFFLRYECYRPPSPHCLEPLLSFMLDTCMTQFSALKGLVIERSLTLTALVFVKIITRQLYTHFNTFLSKPCS